MKAKHKISFLLAIALAVFLWLPIAAIADADSRLAFIESELSSLRSRLERVEQNAGNNRFQVPPQRVERTGAAAEVKVERLATLAIEMKERLDKLEARIKQLEKRLR